jgi:hypothetical protein
MTNTAAVVGYHAAAVEIGVISKVFGMDRKHVGLATHTSPVRDGPAWRPQRPDTRSASNTDWTAQPTPT